MSFLLGAELPPQTFLPRKSHNSINNVNPVPPLIGEQVFCVVWHIRGVADGRSPSDSPGHVAHFSQTLVVIDVSERNHS